MPDVMRIKKGANYVLMELGPKRETEISYTIEITQTSAAKYIRIKIVVTLDTTAEGTEHIISRHGQRHGTPEPQIGHQPPLGASVLVSPEHFDHRRSARCCSTVEIQARMLPVGQVQNTLKHGIHGGGVGTHGSRTTS